MVQGGGFEPPKLSRQIYSLIPLATREPLRKKGWTLSTPKARLSNSINSTNVLRNNGAGERSRTPDRLITSQLLYQLSYASPKPVLKLNQYLNRERDSRECWRQNQPFLGHQNSFLVFYFCSAPEAYNSFRLIYSSLFSIWPARPLPASPAPQTILVIFT